MQVFVICCLWVQCMFFGVQYLVLLYVCQLGVVVDGWEMCVEIVEYGVLGIGWQMQGVGVEIGIG